MLNWFEFFSWETWHALSAGVELNLVIDFFLLFFWFTESLSMRESDLCESLVRRATRNTTFVWQHADSSSHTGPGPKFIDGHFVLLLEVNSSSRRSWSSQDIAKKNQKKNEQNSTTKSGLRIGFGETKKHMNRLLNSRKLRQQMNRFLCFPLALSHAQPIKWPNNLPAIPEVGVTVWLNHPTITSEWWICLPNNLLRNESHCLCGSHNSTEFEYEFEFVCRECAKPMCKKNQQQSFHFRPPAGQRNVQN